MAKNMHNKKFSEETKLKLDIFRECFREWFPVFVHQKFWNKLYIYDLFAGSGYDAEGSPGSPLILLEEAKGDDSKHCIALKQNNKEVTFVFNEYEPNHKKQKKFEELKSNIEKYKAQCQNCNNCASCYFKTHTINMNFGKEFKTNTNIQRVLNNEKIGKFVILDQYGFTQVDAEVFTTLVNSKRTDFIFFISSSFLKRFKEHDVSKQFIGDSQLSFDESKPKECHQVIVKYFESLIPIGKEYYLNHFTIKKGTNYYGLIFGTSHTLGMEKFQRVCWHVDQRAGESNCNTQDDYEPNTLFGHLETNKVHSVKDILRQEILSSKITNNITGLKRALELRCLPIVFTEVIKDLIKEDKISRDGCSSFKSTDIHRIKVDGSDYYKIKIL